MLYVHVLHLHRRRGGPRASILHLTDLTVRAFGSTDAVADQDAYMRGATRPR